MEGDSDWDTHLALVATLSDPQRRPSTEARQARRWALAGLVRCGTCGSRMDGRAQNRAVASGGTSERRQYVCNSANGGCSTVAITAPDLERHVIGWALDNAPEPDAEPDRGRASATAGDDADALRRLRELEERKRGLGGAYAEGLMTPAQVREATVLLDREIAETRGHLSSAERVPQPRTYLRTVGQFWDFVEGKTSELPAEGAEATNEFLRWAIDRVSVGPARARGIRFDESRVEITPRSELATGRKSRPGTGRKGRSRRSRSST